MLAYPGVQLQQAKCRVGGKESLFVFILVLALSAVLQIVILCFVLALCMLSKHSRTSGEHLL